MKRHFFRCLILLLPSLWLAGCVGAPQSAALLQQYDSAAHLNQTPAFASPFSLDDVPFFPQEEYQCGPAALATVLQYSEVSVVPDELVSQVYVPARHGSLQIEMLAAPRRYGRLSYQLPTTLDALLQEVQAGHPVLVMQNLAITQFPQWHYAVVVGFDLDEGKLILRSGTRRDYHVKLKVFERTWSRAQHWAFVVLQPGELPHDANELSYFQSVSSYESVGEEKDIALAYRAGLQRWPASQLLGMGYGNLAYRAGDLALAGDAYSTLIDHNPDYAAAHNNLAQVFFEQGRYQEAELHARSAVSQGGNFSEVYRQTLDKIVSAKNSSN